MISSFYSPLRDYWRLGSFLPHWLMFIYKGVLHQKGNEISGAHTGPVAAASCVDNRAPWNGAIPRAEEQHRK
jgi:hypothetical protein